MTRIIRHLRAEPVACALDALALAAWCAGVWGLFLIAWGVSA